MNGTEWLLRTQPPSPLQSSLHGLPHGPVERLFVCQFRKACGRHWKVASIKSENHQLKSHPHSTMRVRWNLNKDRFVSFSSSSEKPACLRLKFRCEWLCSGEYAAVNMQQWPSIGNHSATMLRRLDAVATRMLTFKSWTSNGQIGNSVNYVKCKCWPILKFKTLGQRVEHLSGRVGHGRSNRFCWIEMELGRMVTSFSSWGPQPK